MSNEPTRSSLGICSRCGCELDTLYTVCLDTGTKWCMPCGKKSRGVPRESVMRMARRMEAKLCERDDRPCWRNDSPHVLLKWLHGEVKELEQALAEWQKQRIDAGLFGADPARVLAEAADVCNLAMMLSDAVEGIRDEVRGRRAT